MKDETQAHMDSTASQFRQVAGLPERKNDKPSDPLKPSQLRRQAEPQGGYDQRGEAKVVEQTADEDLRKQQAAGEELSAKSGQGATGPVDASTSTDATEKSVAAAGSSDAKAVAKAKDSKPAKKTAAKKSTAKKTAAKKKGA